ncbi:hypothetical protein L218DRAFT_956874 [Marasmius fiardii PR-910]|nr:hypothetical protein L218DRAFT_956874 [Marasmius fiardii PR-910]
MNHPPTGSYSNTTSPRSSMTSSTCGPCTPVTNSNDSDIHRRSVARASVFDAYLQLGMFEENSQLASWVYDDGSASASTSYDDFTTDVDVGSPPVSQFREKSGSRFRERLDSDSPIFVLNNWQEEDSSSSRSSKKKSKPPGWQSNRSNADQRPNSIRFASNTRQQQQSNAARRPFSIFRSRSPRTPSFNTSQEAIRELPELQEPSKKGSKRPTAHRYQTHPAPKSAGRHDDVHTSPLSPLDRPSISSGEWEKIDPLTTLDFNTLSLTENPFLHGPQTPNAKNKAPPTTPEMQVPFPSTSAPRSLSPTLMQRLSAVVTRPFHHSSSNRSQHSSDTPSSYNRASMFHSLRRTQSSAAADTVPRPFLLSSLPPSPPVTSQMHRLMPSVSHS